MYIKNLKLLNFRNYNKLDATFHPKVNILIGDNAQGKTNMIEAIYITSIGKSFRTNRENELIMFNQKEGYIKINGVKEYGDIDIDFKFYQGKKKAIKINNISLKKNIELVDHIYVVIFSPEDLKIVKEGPEKRRRFIDRELCQIKSGYYHNLVQYNKILMQRNKLLKKEVIDYEVLDIWDNQLVIYGSKVIMERENFVKKIEELSQKLHFDITEKKENLKINYLSNIKVDEDLSKIQSNFKKILKENLKKDIKKRNTSSGPHRDDLEIYINDIDVRTFGSQGQQRTASLSLKLSEIELVKEETGEYPILLLDDVLSELDLKRQNYLIESLKKVQIFITTTDLNNLLKNNIKDKKIFNIEKGEIKNIF